MSRLSNWNSVGKTLALAFTCVVLLAPQLAVAASGTWNGATDQNWANTANWTGGPPGVVAGTDRTLATTALTTDTATFNNNPAIPANLTVLPDLNRYVANLTFDSAAGSFTIGQTGGNTLYLAPGTTNIAQTIRGTGLTETLAGPLMFYRSITPDTGSTYTFSNSSFDPTNKLVISGPITTNVGGTTTGTISLGGTGSITGNWAASQTTNTLSSTIDNTGGNLRLTKYGLSNWNITAAQKFNGVLYMWGGTTTLDFNAAGVTTDLLWNGKATANAMSIESGNLILLGSNSGDSTQRAGGNVFKFAAGANLTIAGGTGHSMTLNYADNSNYSFRRNGDGNMPGATLNVSFGTGGAFNLSSTGGSVNNGILSDNANLASVADVTTNNYGSSPMSTGATDWAAKDASYNLIPLASYASDSVVGNWTGGTSNIDLVTTANVPTSGPFAINTLALRTNQAYAITLPTGVNALSMGGILVGSQVGANNVTFSGGSLTGGSATMTGYEVLVHQYNTGTVTFGPTADIVNNGANAVQFTKAGPGTTIFTGTKSYTGSTNVGAGVLQLGDGVTNGAVSSTAIWVAAGAQLVFDTVGTQTNTAVISTDSSGNYLARIVMAGTGTINMQQAGHGSQTPAWEFRNGIVNVTDLSGTATSPFGSYNNSNGNEMWFDGGAMQFTGTAFNASAVSPYNSTTTGVANPNNFYHATVLTGNATYMADGAVGSTPMSVTGRFYVPGSGTHTITLEALNGTIVPGTATTGSYLSNTATTGGGGVFNSTITDSIVPGQGSYTTKVVKTGPGIWQVSQSNLQNTGGLLVSQGTLLLTSTSTGGIYLPNSYQYAGVTVAKSAYLDVGGGNGTAGQFLWLNGPLRGEGTIINSAASGTAGPTGTYGYGAVKMNNSSATHYLRIQPGPTTDTSAPNADSAPIHTIGTLTTGDETWNGYWAQNRYDWDVTSVTVGGGAQPIGGTTSDFLNIQGTLDLTACGVAGGSTEFRIGAWGVSGGAIGSVANWSRHNTYSWTIATATNGITSIANIANMQGITLGGFGPGADTATNNSTSGGTWALTTAPTGVGSGQNLILTYTGTPAATYALVATSDAVNGRVLTGGTATITSKVYNTGSSVAPVADYIDYTGLGISTTGTIGAMSNTAGTYVQPSTNQYNGYGSGNATFTAGSTPGQVVTFNPTAATVINHAGTDAALASAAPAGTSITVVAQRTFTAPAVVSNVLLNANLDSSATFSSTGLYATTTDVTIANTASTDANGVTIAAGSDVFNGTQLTQSGSRALAGQFSTYGVKTGGFTLNGTGEGLVGEGPYAVNVNYTINVGTAALGAAITGGVSNGGAFNGITSKTVAGGAVLGTVAILTGGHSTANVVLSETWRARTGAESTLLISDAVNLTGMNSGDVFALQMSYSATELNTLWGGKSPCLDWLNGSTWQAAGSIYKGDMAAPTGNDLSSELGWYGIDSSAGVVWAVVNHNSDFAAVPEPGTVVMLLSGLGLLAIAWRRKRAA